MDNGRVLKPGQCAQVEIQHLACVLLWDAQSFYKKKHVTNSHNILHIFIVPDNVSVKSYLLACVCVMC